MMLPKTWASTSQDAATKFLNQIVLELATRCRKIAANVNKQYKVIRVLTFFNLFIIKARETLSTRLSMEYDGGITPFSVMLNSRIPVEFEQDQKKRCAGERRFPIMQTISIWHLSESGIMLLAPTRASSYKFCETSERWQVNGDSRSASLALCWTSRF